MPDKRGWEELHWRAYPSTRQLGVSACCLLLILVATVQLDLWTAWASRGHSSDRLYGGGGRSHGLAPPTAGHASSLPMSAPSRSMYYAMLANPGLLETDRGLWEEFEAAPWLLPTRTPLLPHAGVHSFDQLAALRSRPAGAQQKALTILLFSRTYAVMAQNSIYSLVKHGGVRNYVAVTWLPEDLEACKDLNLPCLDASDMLVEPLVDSAKLRQHDLVVMTWVKPAVVLRALQQGYAVMSVDVDVSYTVKPLWESYLAYLDLNQADGAWQAEEPMNSGHFVLLPTAPALRFAEAWNASSLENVGQLVTEQKALQALDNRHYVTCRQTCMCYKRKLQLEEQGLRKQMAVFALYLPSTYVYTQGSGCTLGSQEWMPGVDPCDWAVLFLHPICVGGAGKKQGILQRQGFWFLEQGCPPRAGSASQVPVCHPAHWRRPQAEARLYSCSSYGLGLTHGTIPAAVEALRAGLGGEEAWRLLFASRDKACWPDEAERQHLKPRNM